MKTIKTVSCNAPAGLLIELSLKGMSCASCVGQVEKILKKVPGVLSGTVHLASERASILAVPEIKIPLLIQAVNDLGYEAQVIHNEAYRVDGAEAKRRERKMLRRNLILAAALCAPVMILDMSAHLIPGLHEILLHKIGTHTSWILQFVLTTIILFIPGIRFYKKGLPSLWRLAPDMNSLVAVGTLAAYGFSTLATFAPNLLPKATVGVYYEAAAVIVTLVLLGRFFEAQAKTRTSEAIKRLICMQATTARVRRAGKVIEIPIQEVVLEDIVELRPGERVSVDGVVVEGCSFIDESMITGEATPVEKAMGSSVVSGTVNQTGALSIRATAVGSTTVLAQIIRMVEHAQNSKLPIQAAIDKVTLWFVPTIMGLAALTFLIWFFLGPQPALTFGLVNAIAVLIIACPCAMGLATPTSIIVATGRGAELGIFFRKSEALQILKEAKLIAMDKTGTLTEGKPVLTYLKITSSFHEDKVLRLLAAVESKSEHPIARAIVAAAEKKKFVLPDVQAFTSLIGYGVQAVVEGSRVEIGADRYMIQRGIDLASLAETAQTLAHTGQSPLYAAIDGKLAAIIAVTDPIKETTFKAIQALHNLNLKVAMITGDHQRTADAIARRLGIDEVVAEVFPEGKVQAIQRLKKKYGCVAYVGDGINDAPALATADVGLALGTGTDVAIEAADVVLISGSLQGIPNAMALSRATIRNIHQNLFWAFGYNAVLIPVAAGILYPAYGLLLSPSFSAGAMALSSLFVFGNALRLKRFSSPL